jgi:integrase/recombinase XerC
MDHSLVVPTPPDGIADGRLRVLAADFLDSLTERTRRTYRSNLASFASFVEATSISDAIGTLVRGDAGTAFTLLSRWKSSLVAEGLAGATVNARMTAVRSILGFANDCGLIPWRVRLRRSRVETKDMRGPTPDGMRALFAACEGDSPMAVRDRCLLRLLYNTALRRAEACSLDIGHIDLDRRVMSVMRKGKTVRVDVAIPSTLEAALREWIAVRGGEDGALLRNFDPTKKARSALTVDGVANILHRLARTAGMDEKKVRPHGLRRAGITRALLAMNGNITRVMGFSGHRSPAMVIRYNDAQNDLAREVAAAVESLDAT